MFNLDPAKLLVIAVVAIILLGPDRLPQVARQVGAAWKSFNEFRHRMETEVRSNMPDLPPTSELARLARSPSALLNHLSTLDSDDKDKDKAAEAAEASSNGDGAAAGAGKNPLAGVTGPSSADGVGPATTPPVSAESVPPAPAAAPSPPPAPPRAPTARPAPSEVVISDPNLN
jgi:sec-independent protein translocase protein TatB